MKLSSTEIDQIEALLNHRAYDYACKVLNIDSLEKADYAKVFTVKRPQIDAYIAANGLPSWVLKPGGGAEGLWMWPPNSEGASAFGAGSGKEWLIFYTEGGRTDELGRYQSYDAAIKVCVDFILNMSGTGLNF